MKLLLVVAFLVVSSGIAFADMIDDAEAKRRGVPVEQVIAERKAATQAAAATAATVPAATTAKSAQYIQVGAIRLKTNTPKEVLDYATLLQDQRTKRITDLRAGIEDWNKKPNSPDKTSVLSTSRKQLDAENKDPVGSPDPVKLLREGSIGVNGALITVVQVIDDNNMIVDEGSLTVWLVCPTKGMVDDLLTKLDGNFLWENTGTKTYATALGGSKTVPQLKRKSAIPDLVPYLVK